MKVCTHCKKEKILDDFWYNKKRNMYHPTCKICKYELSKKYICVTKEKKSEYDKTYREKHKDVLNQRKKDEYQRNKQIYINRQIEYQRTLEGRIKHNLRTRISNSIKRKSNSTFDLLGCDIHFYMNYIEFLFDSNMTWENYGSYWHIDHVKQLKDFNLNNIDEQKEAFNWKNTRPLEKSLNLSKIMNNNMYIEQHKLIVTKFLMQHHQIAGTPLESKLLDS